MRDFSNESVFQISWRKYWSCSFSIGSSNEYQGWFPLRFTCLISLLSLLSKALRSYLGICLEKTTIQKDTCSPMFITALFTIDKTWKQLKCPSTDEWIRRYGTYIYTYMYNGKFSAIKKEWNKCHLQQCGWTQRLSHQVKSDRDKSCVIPLVYGI